MTDLKKTLDDLELLNALCHGTVLDDAIALIKDQQEIIRALALHDGAQTLLLEREKQKPEVVRCKDCCWNSGKPYNPYCQLQSRKHKPDWFCADGEKKDG